LETNIVVSLRVVKIRISIPNTIVVSSCSLAVEIVKKLLSQYVRSGFRPGGEAKSGSHLVGGVEIWWNWNVVSLGRASASFSYRSLLPAANMVESIVSK